MDALGYKAPTGAVAWSPWATEVAPYAPQDSRPALKPLPGAAFRPFSRLPASPARAPAIVARRRALIAGRPAAVAGCPASAARRPAAAAGHPAIIHGHPAVFAGRPASAAGCLAAVAGCPSMTAGCPAIIAGCPAAGARRRAAIAGRGAEVGRCPEPRQSVVRGMAGDVGARRKGDGRLKSPPQGAAVAASLFSAAPLRAAPVNLPVTKP